MQTRLNFGLDSSISNLSVSALDTALLPRHRWYYFKEAFSPDFVTYAINNANCTKNDLILDPFSGSGTVPLSATIKGYTASGFEVNPFLAFVAKTKLLQCKPKTIDKHLKDVTAGIQQGVESPLESFSTFSENGGAKKWLFNTEVLQAFEGGWQATIGKHKPIRDVFRLCLIGAAMDASNATKDGKCLRYRRDWKEQRFEKKDFLFAFSKRVNEVKQDLDSCPLKKSKTKVELTDSRQLTTLNKSNEKFKLCVMSPPYLNSFDYTDVYRPELFLGKFVRSQEELQQLRLKTLRSHVQVSWNTPTEMDFGQHFTNSFVEIKERADTLWDKRIPSMIQAYFEDMKQVLSNLYGLAMPDASVWIVVSTSAYAGVEIPVDLIIADIGSQVGWYLREVNVIRYLRRVSVQQWDKLYERKNKKPYLRESVIILDKMPHTRK
ncbi:MAG: hypothetical protein KDJ97_15480 [Anaerolineae bacterium]|nr:hypothetical protein [Anaerolineae bacterium]